MTIGQARLPAIKYIEHAVRRCGVTPALLTSEGLLSAKENLGMILSSMVTQGMELWCVEKQPLAMVVGQPRYALADGTIDVMTVLRRNATFSDATSIAIGLASYNDGTSQAFGSAEVTLATGATSLALVLENSADGTTWAPAGSVTGTYAAGDRVVIDSDNVAGALYWRVRDVAATMVFAAASFLSGITEVAMGILNRDDYVKLTNKSTLSDDPNTFWLDKRIDATNVVLWQAPGSAQRHLVCWVHRQIADVGAYSATIEVPQRWQDAIIFELSTRVFLELPKVQVDPGRYDILKANAAEYLGKAMRGETDGAPVRLMPRISPYTRG
jgi:hypothetical protein